MRRLVREMAVSLLTVFPLLIVVSFSLLYVRTEERNTDGRSCYIDWSRWICLSLLSLFVSTEQIHESPPSLDRTRKRPCVWNKYFLPDAIWARDKLHMKFLAVYACSDILVQNNGSWGDTHKTRIKRTKCTSRNNETWHERYYIITITCYLIIDCITTFIILFTFFYDIPNQTWILRERKILQVDGRYDNPEKPHMII